MIKGLLAMTMIEYALTFLGTPYVWGGNTPEQGLDCSGFVCEVLKSDSRLDNDQDLTSQQLYNKFSQNGHASGVSEKSLVFYGKSVTEITHVAIAINTDQVIEAAGEGRVNTDKGFVRIRPAWYRPDMVAAIRIR